MNMMIVIRGTPRMTRKLNPPRNVVSPEPGWANSAKGRPMNIDTTIAIQITTKKEISPIPKMEATGLSILRSRLMMPFTMEVRT